MNQKMALNEEDLVENVKKFPVYMTNQMMNSIGKTLEKMHGQKLLKPEE